MNRTNSISSIDLNESIDASIESARAGPPRRGSLRSARGAEDNPYLRKQGNSSDNFQILHLVTKAPPIRKCIRNSYHSRMVNKILRFRISAVKVRKP